MNRKPIFDAVRELLGRSFKPFEIKALDEACTLAEAATLTEPARPLAFKATATAAPPPAKAHRLGALSEVFESGNRGPGTVSSGAGDPGGVSYGVYQLSSNAGTLAVFMKAECKPWLSEFGACKPGADDFSTIWKAIATREPDAFRAAQHAFIERTHYQPAIAAVLARKGLDLDSRSDAVRDATWSMAVQHAGAAKILFTAIDATDPKIARNKPGYDKALLEAIYKARTDYVLGVAANPKLPKAQRDQLIGITKSRYPKELAQALAMLGAPPAADAKPKPIAPVVASDGSIDGNKVAAANGVEVKSVEVKISRLHPKMEQAIIAAAKAAKTLGLPKPVITSGNDSNHMKGSLHYQWRALDFRGNNIQPAVGEKFAIEVRKLLGKDYDVAFETFMNMSNNHLHVEYDPD